MKRAGRADETSFAFVKSFIRFDVNEGQCVKNEAVLGLKWTFRVIHASEAQQAQNCRLPKKFVVAEVDEEAEFKLNFPCSGTLTALVTFNIAEIEWN